VYQQQQQQQQQEEQQQDAENPFLDPPFSQIKIVVAKVCGDFGGGWTVGADPCQVPSLTLKSKQKKAKVFPHLVAWVRVGRGIPHGKVFVCLLSLSYSNSKNAI
jgi:hypothetical protein